jgi:hypothetical protein
MRGPVNRRLASLDSGLNSSRSEPLEARPRFRNPAAPAQKFIDHSIPAVQRSATDGDLPMILTGLVGLFAALLGGSEAAPAPSERVRVMTVEERLTIRIPVVPRPRVHIHWDEEKGPKCLPADAIARAFLSGPDSVVFVLRSRQLVRARLDSDCDGLDFYGQLYFQPNDQRICAKRDSIRSRVGGSCRIEKFRMLVPKVER